MGWDSRWTGNSTFCWRTSWKAGQKGVFITTGRFSEDAIDYVNNIEPKVSLIDGRNLANLMIDCNINYDGS